MIRFFFYFLAIALLTVSFFLVQIDVKAFTVYILTSILGITSILIFSRKTIFYSIMFIFYFFPQMNRLGILPIIDTNISFVILIVICFLAFSKMRFNNSYNFFWFLYILLLLLQLRNGILRGYNPQFIFDETIKYLYYPISFYCALSIFDEDNLENILNTYINFNLIMGAVIVLQMVYYNFTVTMGGRVLTRQANLLLISLVSVISLLLFKPKLDRNKKFLFVLLTILYLIGILLFMQRSLWIGTVAALFTLTLIYILKKGKNLVLIISTMIILIIILFSSYFIFKNVLADQEILQSRTEELEDKGIGTFSVAVRIYSYYQIIRKVADHWLTGLGIGDSIQTRYLNRTDMNVVDNSYIVIYWKFGLVGLLIFIIFMMTNFRQVLIIIRSNNEIDLIFAIIVLTNFIGQLFNGLACVVMILYHFNFLWSTQLAFIDKIYTTKYKTIK